MYEVTNCDTLVNTFTQNLCLPMKTITTILLALLLFASCGKNKKEDEPGLFDIIDGVSDLNKIGNELEKMEEENEKLLKVTPISNEKLKTLLPETLLGFPRKKFSVGNQFMASVSMAEAQYRNEEGNGDFITFSIVDGAGETGSAMISMIRLGLARDFEEESDNGYSKSTTIDGHKAIEEQELNYDVPVSKITMLISNRFMITLEGEGVSADQLKKAFNELDLDKLK